MPGIVLGIWHTLFHLTLMIIWWSRYHYHPRFAEKTPETSKRKVICPHSHSYVVGGDKIQIQIIYLQDSVALLYWQ